MNEIWKRLSELDVDNKEKFVEIFASLVREIQDGKFNFNDNKVEKEDYYLIVEEGRLNSYFIHVVPKQAYGLFEEMKSVAPNEFLGFSVLVGKHKGIDVRASCFGVSCNELTKALFNN